MIVPGSNLLNLAMTVIAAQTLTYLRFISRTTNDVGQDVAVYDQPVVVTGSFQPVPRSLYRQYGLDLQKSYFTFYSSTNVIDIYRDVSGDKLIFNSETYQCLSSNDWFAMDGWTGVLCVLVPET